MNKKAMVAIIVIAIVGLGGYFLRNNSDKKKEKTPSNHLSDNKDSNDNQNNEANHDEEIPSSEGKTLIVYYSASGSTKKVAEEIANNLNADLFEIEPVDAYTREDLDWTNENSRVSKEHDDESLRNVKLKTVDVENWESYDTVFIGYPIWWGIAAWPVNTFVASNNFNGKTMIPFCTSASSSLGTSGELLAKEANTGDWKEGHRFSSNASKSDIKSWTDTLK